MTVISVLNLIHTIMLTALLTISALYLVAIIKSRLEMRRVLLAWYTPKRLPVPRILVSTFAVLIALWTYLSFQMNVFSLWEIAGYFLVSNCLLVAGLLSTTTIITDYGIVHHFGNCHQSLAFGQVEDYFIQVNEKQSVYVFFYCTDQGTRERFELLVPFRYENKMRYIVSEKLDARFDFNVYHSYGTKALND
jgi:hypothetical protein